jgi:hypothetical protein
MKTITTASLAALLAISANAQPLPDLRAKDFYITELTTYLEVDPGQTVPVQWTAQNIGFFVSNSDQGVMWSTDTNISRDDTLLVIVPLRALEENGFERESLSITIPSNATPGKTYYVGVYEDYKQVISEGIETNNASTHVTFKIKGEAPPVNSPEIRVKSGGVKFVSGQKLKFGKVKAKQKKKTKTITIKNTGTDDLMIDNIYEDGSKKSKKHFKENGPKNKKLAPGKSLKVKVTFKPQSKGEKMVTLRIRSNDSDEGKFDIILKGKGKK